MTTRRKMDFCPICGCYEDIAQGGFCVVCSMWQARMDEAKAHVEALCEYIAWLGEDYDHQDSPLMPARKWLLTPDYWDDDDDTTFMTGAKSIPLSELLPEAQDDDSDGD